MDKIEVIGGATVQHGKMSNRVYLMKTPESYDISLIESLEAFLKTNKYDKFFAKIPASQLPLFLPLNFQIEARVPGMYRGIEDGFFVSKFYRTERTIPEYDAMEYFSQLLEWQKNTLPKSKSNSLPVEILKKEDASEMAELFKQVFDTYPFPIFDSGYIQESMDNDVVFFGIRINNALCAISSAEIDNKHQFAEMTDFATLPEARGKGLSKQLLEAMEKEMHNRCVKTAYTIARLKSVAMNKTFLSAGYIYSGTLIKNTNISGGIESMNVLYKNITNNL
jgi:putative beta-lysine N-acetyltransferase